MFTGGFLYWIAYCSRRGIRMLDHAVAEIGDGLTSMVELTVGDR